MSAQVEFAGALARHGTATALITEHGSVSYAELAQRVDVERARLGQDRVLVALEARPTTDAVVTYLAALAGGHPVIVTDPARSCINAELRERFPPDLVVDGHGGHRRRTVHGDGAGARPLHEDLRLLLSTSGSTGSPKLVRLSAANIQSNAEAVAASLGLTRHDRGITSLPLGYCYGLSVLHSHLQVGASVVLTDRSVTDSAFWSLAQASGITSFAGVPHTFDLLERSPHRWFAVPSLRIVTQAGGRLAPDRVASLTSLGRQHDWELVVMYGQTEATARMAVLDPAERDAHPASIGRAVLGGALRVDAADADGVGELVYTGPNVMMGYAESPHDLARGAEVGELRTGDRGREVSPGLFCIEGRSSRFAKVLGHRIDLDRVQAALDVWDTAVTAASDDARLVLATRGTDILELRRHAAVLTGLPPHRICVVQHSEIPMLSNGKPDYPAILASARPIHESSTDDRARAGTGARDRLRASYCRILGYGHIANDATFVSLGGDSLSYVEVSCEIEDVLGWLPDDWAERSLTELAALARPSTAATRSRSRVTMETSVVLRAAAIVQIIMGHLGVWGVLGGAHTLMALAGFMFARFQLRAIRASGSVVGLRQTIVRLALPCMAFIAIVFVTVDGYSPANAILLSHYLGPQGRDITWHFWFVEALVEILLVMLALMAFPAVRRFERAHPLLLPSIVVAGGLALWWVPSRLLEMEMPFSRPHAVLWIFALGWLLQRVQSLPGRRSRLIMSAVILATLLAYFAPDVARALVASSALLLLLWLPTLPVPARLATPIRRIAWASLWIYLTHFVAWPFLVTYMPPVVGVVACILIGIATAGLVSAIQRAASRLTRHVAAPAASRPAEDGTTGGWWSRLRQVSTEGFRAPASRFTRNVGTYPESTDG